MHIPQHMLKSTANILRGSCMLAKQTSSSGTTGVDPKPLGSQGIAGLGRTTRARRGQEPHAHEQGNSRSLTLRLSVGDIVVFPLGLFDDAPNRRVRGLVKEKRHREWILEAQCDKSDLHVPKGLMAEMLKTGTAHVIGS